MECKITRATEKDIPLMQRSFYQTVTMTGGRIFDKKEVKLYSKLAIDKSHWKEKFSNDFVFNAKLNGEVIGSFLLNNDGTIEYFLVHKNYRGKGIANRLYEVLEETARKHHIKKMTTYMNEYTKPFFQKKGFTLIENNNSDTGEKIIEDPKAV